MKLNNFQMIASSVAALGGLALAVYQVAGPARAPSPAAPVQVTLTVDKNGNPVAAPSATPVEAGAAAVPAADATQLLGNMRASLAVVAAGYAAEVKKPDAHRSGSLVLTSTQDTTSALKALDTALTSKNSPKIAAASRDLTKSVGRLQTTYALSPTKPAAADAGMKSLNANWNVYAARYMVQNDAKVAQNAADVKKLAKQVKDLRQRVAVLEKKTAKSPALNRQVVNIGSRLDYQTQQYDKSQDYAALLVTLTLIAGDFDGLMQTSQFYYPDYYDDFAPQPAAYDLSDAYWNGYYDGYYDAKDEDWASQYYAVPAEVAKPADPVIVQYQNVNYTQIINITNQAVTNYEALPVEDLSRATVAQPSPGVMSDPKAIDAIAAAPVQPVAAEQVAPKPEAPAAAEQPVPQAAPAAAPPAAEAPKTDAPAATAEAPKAEAASQAVEAPKADAPAAAAEPPKTDAPAPAAEPPKADAPVPAAEAPAEPPVVETPKPDVTSPETSAAPPPPAEPEAPAVEPPAPQADAPAAEAPAEQPVSEPPAPQADAPAAEAPAEQPVSEPPAPEVPAVETPADSAPEAPAAAAPADAAAPPADAPPDAPAPECVPSEDNPCPPPDTGATPQ